MIFLIKRNIEIFIPFLERRQSAEVRAVFWGTKYNIVIYKVYEKSLRENDLKFFKVMDDCPITTLL